jgi:predicted transport protein
MKKLLKITLIAVLSAFTITACKHQAKEEEISLQQNVSEVQDNDKITKDVYTDEFGDQLEVTLNETQNTITIRLNGKSYELKKNEELPEYTATDADYQYSDIRGDVTFLKKDYNMVLFHHKKDQSSSSGTKMASY